MVQAWRCREGMGRDLVNFHRRESTSAMAGVIANPAPFGAISVAGLHRWMASWSEVCSSLSSSWTLTLFVVPNAFVSCNNRQGAGPAWNQ